MSMDLDKAKKRNASFEGPPRIDHSDVYFENDRLSEDLGIVKDIILKYKHRQYLNRDGQIKEIRRNLVSLEAMKKSAHHTQRPKTSPAFFPRTGNPFMSETTERRKSSISPAKVFKLNVHIPDDDSDDFSDSDDSVVRMKQAVSKAKARMKPQPITKIGLLKRQLQSKKFPSSWYSEVLQPSDAIVKTPSHPKVIRDSGKKGRVRPGAKSANQGQVRGQGKGHADDLDPSLVCDRSKSAVLSRRKLIQMTNLDYVSDTEEKVEPFQALREMNRIQNDRLQVRIKMFLDSLEEVKKKREEERLARMTKRMYMFGPGGLYEFHEPLW